jgi:hypothetical protein
MVDIPNIFDLLQRFDFLRGEPAVFMILAAALVAFVFRDWRASIFAMMTLYLFSGLLYADLLDPRLAAVKIVVGLFIALILYLTGRQVSWGRLPEDVTPEEALQLQKEKYLRLGKVQLAADVPLRLGLAAVILLLARYLAQYQPLPVVPDHLNLAVYGLAGIGLVGLSLMSEPFRAGIGLLTFWSGCDLFYSALEQSSAILALLAAAVLITALVIAYLIQARYAFRALLD